MDRGAWQATAHGVAESDMTEQISLQDGRLSRPRQAQGVVKAQGRRPHLARVGVQGGGSFLEGVMYTKRQERPQRICLRKSVPGEANDICCQCDDLVIIREPITLFS